MRDYCDAATLDRYRQVLRAYAMRQGLATEADDIAQEAIARLLEHRDDLDLTRDPFPWLMTVTMRLCVSAHRARARVTVADDTEMEVHSPATAPSALDLLLAGEESQTVLSALGRLPRRERTIFYRRHVLDDSYEALSTDLDVTVNALRAQVFRTRKRLALLLEDARSFGLVALERVRNWWAALPAELPAVAANTLAQAAVPLALLAGAVTGVVAPSPSPGILMASRTGIAADQDIVAEVRLMSAAQRTSDAASAPQPATAARPPDDATNVAAGPASVRHEETDNSSHDKVAVTMGSKEYGVEQHERKGEGPSLLEKVLYEIPRG